MKHTITLLFFLIATSLIGQGSAIEDTLALAKQLHEEGKMILEQNNGRAYDKILAFAKFRKSQQFFNELKKGQPSDLKLENESQINSLVDFFSSNSDKDSLLELTRFYPDSVFSADNRYTPTFKLLFIKLLDQKKRKLRNDFFKIDGLHNTDPPLTSEGTPFILDFENYWPLEVMEFDKELQITENNYLNNSKKTKEDLLFAQYKSKLDSINFLIKNDSLLQIVQYVRQQKENATLEAEEVKQQHNNFRNIVFGVIAILLLAGFFAFQKSNRLFKNLNQTLLEEKHRSEELLLNILPAEVARELKSHASVKPKKHEQACVLFSDFKNFSQIAKNLTPEELVAELDNCFSAFDRIIDKHRLQKIKTIGDAYMCVGGLHTQGTVHVRRMVLAALEIQQLLENMKKRRQELGRIFFEARIGIHTGAIVAGVVGSKKFAFDVWGDTVNVAQQMEYHCEPGMVNISGETYELIKDQFNCIFRSKVVVKNMKAFDMYYVEGVREADI